jgi:hypothetical protein
MLAHTGCLTLQPHIFSFLSFKVYSRGRQTHVRLPFVVCQQRYKKMFIPIFSNKKSKKVSSEHFKRKSRL